MLDAEERSERGDWRSEVVTPEKMGKAEMEGLCNSASVDIFLQWYTFGGMQRGLTLTEILQMPAWLRKDFRFILGIMSTRRTERKRTGSLFEEKKPAKKGRRNAR